MDKNTRLFHLGQVVGAARALAHQTFHDDSPPLSCLRQVVFLCSELADAAHKDDAARMAFLAATCAGTLTRLIELLEIDNPGLIEEALGQMQRVAKIEGGDA
jgi:hypothetical protein